MIEVLLHQDRWRAEILDVGVGEGDISFKFRGGIVVLRKNVTTPDADGWDGVSYVIRFAEEKEAAWFVLAVGGKIYNG